MSNYRNQFRREMNYCDDNMHHMKIMPACQPLPLAIATVPMQVWANIIETPKALYCGTIFEDLYLPFLGSGGCRLI